MYVFVLFRPVIEAGKTDIEAGDLFILPLIGTIN
jgi:hypothetical protein